MFKDEKENPANFIRLLEWVACDAYLCYMTGLLVCRLWISGLMAKRRRTLYESKWLIMSVYVVVNFLSQLIFIFLLFLGMVMNANEFETKEI